jgi:large subunit ribosomal protein L32
MGLPAKKSSRSSKRRRASHFALKKMEMSSCSHCKKKILPHKVCPFCGYYAGREIIKIKIKTKAGKKKQKEGKKEKPRAKKEEKPEKK